MPLGITLASCTCQLLVLPRSERAVHEAGDIWFRPFSLFPLLFRGVLLLGFSYFLVQVFGLSFSFVSSFPSFRVPFPSFFWSLYLSSILVYVTCSCYCCIALCNTHSCFRDVGFTFPLHSNMLVVFVQVQTLRSIHVLVLSF